MYPSTSDDSIRPLTLQDFAHMREEGEKIACLTAYDASFAKLEDAAGVEVVLVGDSLGMVIHGEPTTVAVTVDDIVYHTVELAKSLEK